MIPHPLANEDEDRVDRHGEAALIAAIRATLGDVAPACPEGPGDDTAVLPARLPAPNLVTVDTVVRGRHFVDALDPRLAGAKLVNRNLSDLAAMGGRPLGSVLALLVPAATSRRWLLAFVEGVATAARAAGLAVNGGDVTTTAADLAGVLTAWGHAPRPVTRRGGRPGDELWVTGELGGAWFGDHHATFRPQLDEGAWLASRHDVLGMMDISDGLAKDLPELLPAGACARLDVDALPARPDALRHAAASGRPLVDHLLGDGEDHGLAFAAAASFAGEGAAAFGRSFPETRLTRVGRIVADRDQAGRLVDGRTGALLAQGGHDPFRGGEP